MAERIHLVLEPAEKERYRSAAAREGKSLSRWLREAAAQRLAAAEEQRGIDSLQALDAFFRECDEREVGREPDWEAHRQLIEHSMAAGAGRPS